MLKAYRLIVPRSDTDGSGQKKSQDIRDNLGQESELRKRKFEKNENQNDQQESTYKKQFLGFEGMDSFKLPDPRYPIGKPQLPPPTPPPPPPQNYQVKPKRNDSRNNPPVQSGKEFLEHFLQEITALTQYSDSLITNWLENRRTAATRFSKDFKSNQLNPNYLFLQKTNNEALKKSWDTEQLIINIWFRHYRKLLGLDKDTLRFKCKDFEKKYYQRLQNLVEGKESFLQLYTLWNDSTFQWFQSVSQCEENERDYWRQESDKIYLLIDKDEESKDETAWFAKRDNVFGEFDCFLQKWEEYVNAGEDQMSELFQNRFAAIRQSIGDCGKFLQTLSEKGLEKLRFINDTDDSKEDVHSHINSVLQILLYIKEYFNEIISPLSTKKMFFEEIGEIVTKLGNILMILNEQQRELFETKKTTTNNICDQILEITGELIEANEERRLDLSIDKEFYLQVTYCSAFILFLFGTMDWFLFEACIKLLFICAQENDLKFIEIENVYDTIFLVWSEEKRIKEIPEEKLKARDLIYKEIFEIILKRIYVPEGKTPLFNHVTYDMLMKAKGLVLQLGYYEFIQWCSSLLTFINLPETKMSHTEKENCWKSVIDLHETLIQNDALYQRNAFYRGLLNICLQYRALAAIFLTDLQFR
jgi:hypothetical protein